MRLLESLQNIDQDLFHVLNQAGSNLALDVLMTVFTAIGISFVMASFAILLWVRRRRDLAIDYLVLIAFVSILAEVIKLITDRQRPIDMLTDVNSISFLGITSASGPSLPSGHAARAFAAASLLSYGRGTRTYVMAFALAVLVAVSRVYLGLHWPSDILYGAILGVLGAQLIKWCAGPEALYGRVRSRLVRFIESLSMHGKHPAAGGTKP